MEHGVVSTGAAEFGEIINMIEESRQNALRKVNEELIMLYYNVGKFLSEQSENHRFGDKYITDAAEFIAKKYPGIRGFNRRGLYRMKQFYETYCEDEFVSPVVTQISWTNHLLILSACQTAEQRHFYIDLCVKNHYSKRQLERQLDSAYYERCILSRSQLPVPAMSPEVKGELMDSYVFEFLNLPSGYSELDFKKAIMQNMKEFLLEIGRDFIFIGEEYRVQAGGHDYYIDLLFYHRGLSCLAAFELKIGEFKPEYIGKMDFYLEALDREHRKANENPSVGIILCTSKDDEVVEFAMSRSMSPTMVADYTIHLPDKKLLQRKLREITELAEESSALQEKRAI